MQETQHTQQTTTRTAQRFTYMVCICILDKIRILTTQVHIHGNTVLHTCFARDIQPLGIWAVVFQLSTLVASDRPLKKGTAYFKLQSNLDNSNSDISNSAKHEAFI